MPVDWSMAAVIVAILCIPLVISPEASNRLACLWTWVRRMVQPSRAVCERLLWDDIPEGLLHTDTNTNHCSPTTYLSMEDVAEVFDRAWNSPARRGKLVKKPKKLSLDKEYLQIDRMAALALLLITDSIDIEFEEKHGVLLNRRGELPTKSPRVASEWQVLVPAIRSRVAEEYRQITKAEMSYYIQGYPQFYKTTLRLPHGTSIPYPIRDIQDVMRGGWIIATGLEDWEGESPIRLHRYYSRDRASASKTNPLQALVRVHRTLLDLVLAHCPEEKLNIEMIARAIDSLSDGYDSTWLSYLSISDYRGKFRRKSDVDKYGPISDEQACMAIKLFNDYRPLEASEIDCIRAIIRPLLAVCLRGARTVSIYYHRDATAIEEPPMLRKHRYLYFQGGNSKEE